MTKYDMPIAPSPEPAADGWTPGQDECRTPTCADLRSGFTEHCREHQPKAKTPLVDWDFLRQQPRTKGRRGKE